jgi:NAD-dependent DNA ligase
MLSHHRYFKLREVVDDHVESFKKFINVSVEELLKMEGFQRKSAEKVVNEIQESLKKADCLTFMTASNLFGRSIAEKKLKLILEVFPEIPNGYQPTESELSKVAGIGEITAKQFLEGLPLFFDFMKEINKECKKVEKVVVPKGKSLEGLNVVFTGVRDKELEAEIETNTGVNNNDKRRYIFTLKIIVNIFLSRFIFLYSSVG